MAKNEKSPKPAPFPVPTKGPKFNDINKGPKSFKNAPAQSFNQRPNRSGGQRGR
ncbi:MAG: hypothetical protein JNK58_05155 [Phycisphaerae bacterium]|nr:hypothetical protein [Phycisphaerae bacterium]